MKHYLIGGAALVILSACATKADPSKDVIQTEPVVTAPEPVPEVVEPEALPPVVQNVPEPVAAAPQIDPNLPIPGSIEDFAYQSGGESRVYFGYDQYDLSPEARDILRRQADWMNLYSDATASIEGHADERGTREYNLALGARRADSVRAFLISQGVAPNRLRSISYGKERPIDPTPSESGWSRNRNGFTNLRIGGVS